MTSKFLTKNGASKVTKNVEIFVNCRAAACIEDSNLNRTERCGTRSEHGERVSKAYRRTPSEAEPK